MELKPCPFCGEKEIAVFRDFNAHVERYEVCCQGCAAQIYRANRKKAIEAWNGRADNGT